MPKPKQVKCRQCGKQVDKSAVIALNSKVYVCSEQCRDEWTAAHAPRPKQPQSSAPSPMRQLTDYVQTYAPNTSWVKFGANVQRMCKDGMTIDGIHYTLRYIREHENKQVQDDGLGLVPYYWDAAKAHYQWQQRMKQQVADWMPQDDDTIIVRRDVEEEIFV